MNRTPNLRELRSSGQSGPRKSAVRLGGGGHMPRQIENAKPYRRLTRTRSAVYAATLLT
jgi:hypothetical protein